MSVEGLKDLCLNACLLLLHDFEALLRIVTYEIWCRLYLRGSNVRARRCDIEVPCVNKMSVQFLRACGTGVWRDVENEFNWRFYFAVLIIMKLMPT